MLMTASLHANTPTLSAVDPRNLPVRMIGYCRQHAAVVAQPRIQRHAYNPAGHLQTSWDARLWALNAVANLSITHSLSGKALLTESVDAGWKLALFGEAGQPQCAWDARGTVRQLRCDPLMRPIEVGETAAGAIGQIIERYTYADASASFARHNQCGRLVRQDDPAGSLHLSSYALDGGPNCQTRHFLSTSGAVDWPAPAPERDLLLEPGNGFTTVERRNAARQVITRTDARLNRTEFRHTPDGRPGPVTLHLAGSSQPIPLLVAIDYDAGGQMCSQTAGNGVVTDTRRDPASGHLLQLRCALPGKPALQDLRYQYDPVGNIVEIIDAAVPVRHFANQRIDPRCEYRHDSLYQLVEASGREFADARPGPGLPALQPMPSDAARQCNYRQHYEYDAAGNLLCLRHVGGRNYTRTLAVDPHSNRALPVEDDPQRGGISEAFDACGNLLRLAPGQATTWNPRNQLEQISPVRREMLPDDREHYSHDAAGMRLRKVSQRLASGRVLTADVRYLPGLELLHDEASGETLQVLHCETGHAAVQILHWERGLAQGAENDQQRYQVQDHLGSHALELNAHAEVLTHELYYPHGGTAWWAATSTGHARHKRRRHAGRERDASGLYYYGLRYYAPWLQRWINPDPAGHADGHNLYRMVDNRPLNFTDAHGTVKIPVDILLADVIDPTQPSIGTGWFEELSWNSASQGFVTSGTVYGRGLEHTSGTPQWSLSDEGSAIALFRDANDDLRLFTNTFHQHMGIQPGMGLPLFAGLIQRGEHGQIVFNNHSGHYKPAAAPAEVDAWLNELAPGASNLRYAPIEVSKAFALRPRLESVTSPEHYAGLVASFRHDKRKLIDYLKEHNLWERTRAEFGDNTLLNILFEMDDTSLSADDVHQRRHAAATLQAQVQTRPATPHHRPAPAVPSRHTATRLTAHKPRGLLGIFRKCAGH